MRDRNFRRIQEAKHYKKRLNNAINKGLFKKETDNDGYTIIIAQNNKKSYLFNENKDYTFGPSKEEVKNKNWCYLLRKGNVLNTKWLTRDDKRECRRIRRHFQKLVDYQLPDHIWYDRCQVIYPRDIV